MLIINCNSEALSYLKRQPGANTIAYYKLENDTKDYSGHNYNANGSSNISFVNIGNKNVVKLTSNNGGISIPGYLFDSIGTGDFTISYFLKPVGKGNTGSGEALTFCLGKDTSPYY